LRLPKSSPTPSVPTASATRHATHWANPRNQWAPLTVFLDDIRIEPTNIISERLLRTIALGRKNYLFVGHEEAGDNLAMLCSLITTCTLHGVKPIPYFEDVLIRVQTHPCNQIEQLSPHRWMDTFGNGDPR